MNMTEYEAQTKTISIDNILHVGDPCYIVGEEASSRQEFLQLPKQVKSMWERFENKTPYGVEIKIEPGEYNVTAQIADGRVTELSIEFNGNKPRYLDYKNLGSFFVDAGVCWIGDPWHLIKTQRTWSDFCKELRELEELNENLIQTIENGVVSSTGYGDGEYYVDARVDSNGVAWEVLIQFIEQDREDCW